MSQFFARPKPTKDKVDETNQRAKDKIADLTKNSADRLRYLKQLIGRRQTVTRQFFRSHRIYLEQSSIDEQQAFFKNSYQVIFYLFFESFSQVESNATRGRR